MEKYNLIEEEQNLKLLSNKLENLLISSFSFFMLLVIASGCISTTEKLENNSDVIARYTPEPVKIDGKINEKVWQHAVKYKLGPSKKNAKKYFLSENKNLERKHAERGEFGLLWDKDYLYICIKYYDSDIVAEGEKDQLHHYLNGDVAEVFLKPGNETYYWELYVTPSNKKSCFFLPGRGRLFLPSCEIANMVLKTGAYVNGTINEWQDRDKYWTAEIAVPIKGLTQYGTEFLTNAQWKILISRYNYSRYLSIKQLSSYPVQDKTNFHAFEDYSLIKFVK